jgi:hypothetical protein
MAECVFQGSYLVSIIRVSAGKQKSHLVTVFAYMLLDNMVISSKLMPVNRKSMYNHGLCSNTFPRASIIK